MTIYTRTGDDGTTSLLSEQRIQKDNLILCVCGDTDELSSVLGIARAEGLSPLNEKIVFRVQNELLKFNAEIVSPEETPARITPEHIRQLEQDIDAANLLPFSDFVIFGENKSSAYLHFARAVCRRAERNLVTLSRIEPAVSGLLLQYVNRLSDLLFVLAEKEAND